jgi:hypothetical protein
MKKSLLCLLALILFASSIMAQQSKPNLVFVFSDQQSFDMLGCYGNEQIKKVFGNE